MKNELVMKECVWESEKKTVKGKSRAFVPPDLTSPSSLPISLGNLTWVFFSSFLVTHVSPRLGGGWKWSEQEGGENKPREWKRGEIAVARSQTLPAYSAPSAALRRLQLWDVKIFPTRALTLRLFRHLYAHFLGGGVSEGEANQTY